MLAIIGWLTMVIVLLNISAGVSVLLFNNMGRYNIGGVPNSVATKVLTFIAAMIVAALWIFLFKVAPFSISFTG